LSEGEHRKVLREIQPASAGGAGWQCGVRPNGPLHCIVLWRTAHQISLAFDLCLFILSLTTTNHPHTTNRMTSPVPLTTYNQHGDYTDSTIMPSKDTTTSHEEVEYDPYTDTSHLEASTQGPPWNNTDFEDSAERSMHKPSLSYDSKEPGKWPRAIPQYPLSDVF